MDVLVRSSLGEGFCLSSLGGLLWYGFHFVQSSPVQFEFQKKSGPAFHIPFRLHVNGQSDPGFTYSSLFGRSQG